MNKEYLIGKRFGELTGEEQMEILTKVSGTYESMMGKGDGEDVTIDFINGLSIAGKRIKDEEEIGYEIDFDSKFYDPEA